MKRLIRIAKQQFLGATALAIVLAGGAYAATGQNFILGRSNEADTTTTLKNTGAGPALDLKVKTGTPPLKVSSTKQVRKLNASLLGGNPPSNFAPAKNSPNYLSSDGPQVLYADGGTQTANGTLLLNSFGVPSNGRLTILVTGTCTVAAATHFVQMSVDGDSRSQSQPGDSGCAFTYTWDVTGPDVVDVEVTYSQSQAATFYSAVTVFFQPS